ncbi:MAG: hypothetical protein LIO77_07385, partial [Rikenellaceae bacterium]|nr:hypothetical protein [Rikenellaceae bacterium]
GGLLQTYPDAADGLTERALLLFKFRFSASIQQQKIVFFSLIQSVGNPLKYRDICRNTRVVAKRSYSGDATF